MKEKMRMYFTGKRFGGKGFDVLHLGSLDEKMMFPPTPKGKFEKRIIKNDDCEFFYAERGGKSPRYMLWKKEDGSPLINETAQHVFKDKFITYLLNQKKEKEKKWAYHIPQEEIGHGEYDTEAAAIIEAVFGLREYNKCYDTKHEVFAIGWLQKAPFVASGIDVDSFVDGIVEGHCSEYGESADDAYNVFAPETVEEENDLENRLIEAFTEWAIYYGKIPSWYSIEDTKEININDVVVEFK